MAKGEHAVLATRYLRGLWLSTLVILGSVLSTATTVVLRTTAFAADATVNVLRVSPVRSDVTIKPGETQIVKTTVTNLTPSTVLVRPIENDFIAGDERGTPALILDADKYAPTHSLKRFMKPLADISIPAKQAKEVDVVISVSADAQPGGYFGALRFAPTSSENGGQVNLSGSVASIILLSVPGDAIEKLNLTTFDVQQNGTTGTLFQNGQHLQVLARFENKGNVQEGPFGVLSVKKGDKAVYSTKFNDNIPRDMILPDSARRWDIPLDKIDGFGYYTAIATFTYGAKNQTIEVTKSFWVIPPIVVIIAAGGLLLLIVLVVVTIFLIRRRRRRNSFHNFGNNYRRR